MKTIKTKVVGVTQENDDGSDRQRIIGKYVEPEDTLLLEREPDNQYDRNAIAIHAAPVETLDHDDKIGYISSDLAANLAPLMDSGHRITCVVLDKTGGGGGKSYGVNIELTIYTPKEVTEHYRKREEEKAARAATNPISLPTSAQSVTPAVASSKKKKLWLSLALGSIALLCGCCAVLAIISQIQQ